MSETRRRLLTPDEVRRLPRSSQLLFVRGAAPVLAQRLDYLEDKEYGCMADPNPMHAFDHAATPAGKRAPANGQGRDDEIGSSSRPLFVVLFPVSSWPAGAAGAVYWAGSILIS